MTARTYLSQSLRLNQRINSKLEQIQSLRELATKCTPFLTGMPKSPNQGSSVMADAVIKIVNLEAELQQDIDRLVDLKKEIMTVIKAVDNYECQTLLELRYLCFKSWERSANTAVNVTICHVAFYSMLSLRKKNGPSLVGIPCRAFCMPKAR